MLLFTDKAIQDLTLAVEWYDEQKKGLGDYLLQQIDIVLIAVKRNPSAYKKVYKEFRQAAVKKFPYVIMYTLDNKSIIVLAIFHTSQHPKKLAKRI